MTTNSTAGPRAARAALLLGAASLLGCPAKSAPPASPAAVPSVTVARPVVRKVTAYVLATGSTQATQTVEVTPRVKGVLESVRFKDGQRVRGPRRAPAAGEGGEPQDVPGDLLFVIDPRPFEAHRDRARADLALTLASEAQAALRLERLEDALKDNAIPELDVILQRAIVQQQKAQVAAARASLRSAELDVEFAHVRAPIDGVISRTRATPGNVVGDGALATIVQDRPIHVYFAISDRDLLELQKAHPDLRTDARDIGFEVGLANEAGHPHAGRIDYVDPYVDPKTGTITVRGMLPNADGALLPGLFVRVRVPLGTNAGAVLVSERALGTDQGQKFVLVANDKNVLEYRAVRLGPVDEGLRVVEEGVKPTDRIVVNGLLRVRAGVTVDPKPGEMPLAGAKPGK